MEVPGTVCKLMDITSQSALFVKSESKKIIIIVSVDHIGQHMRCLNCHILFIKHISI